jgi:hypothetical protein
MWIVGARGFYQNDGKEVVYRRLGLALVEPGLIVARVPGAAEFHSKTAIVRLDLAKRGKGRFPYLTRLSLSFKAEVA